MKITTLEELRRACVKEEMVIVRRIDGLWHAGIPWQGPMGRVRYFGSFPEAIREAARVARMAR